MVKTLGKKIKQTVGKSYFRISNAKVKFSDCNFLHLSAKAGRCDV